MRRITALPSLPCLWLLGFTILHGGPGGQAEAADVRIVDGDTIVLNGDTIRLDGIDAPELAQTCLTARGDSYACGRASQEHLMRLAGSAPVHCEVEERDAYDRRIATCFSGTRNLNEAMVRDGHAYAFVKYSARYQPAEQAARHSKAGLWAGYSAPPWDYRKSKWQVAGATAPAGCPIKGNISANGRIYHTPWSPHYARTRINEAAGERWFCSEDEAVAAGWRPPLS